MGAIKDTFKIIIPKVFNYQNFSFHLKRDLKGTLLVFTSNTCQYRGESNKIIIDKKKVLNEAEMERVVKTKIADVYFDNIGTLNKLSEEDNLLFNLIDYVVDTNRKRPKVLFIGYKYNYPDTIKNTLERSNFDCETLLLEQNIELYNPKVRLVNNNCDPIFKMITDKVEKGRYDNYVLDIPNLSLMTDDYTNTKKLLSYLKSKNKKMIVLNSGTKTKFNRIFGQSYDDMVMDEKYVIRCGRHETVKDQIKSILL